MEDGSKRTSTALFSRRRFNAPSVVGKLDPLASPMGRCRGFQFMDDEANRC